MSAFTQRGKPYIIYYVLVNLEGVVIWGEGSRDPGLKRVKVPIIDLGPPHATHPQPPPRQANKIISRPHPPPHPRENVSKSEHAIYFSWLSGHWHRSRKDL